MTIPSNPLSDEVQAALQKEKDRIAPKLRSIEENIDKIAAETTNMVTQVKAKLDQLVADDPTQAEKAQQARQKLDALAASTVQWASSSKQQLEALLV